jgi:hypothetical protein
MTQIQSTSKQRSLIAGQDIGVGFVIIKTAGDHIVEAPVFLDKEGCMRFMHDGKPVLFEFDNETNSFELYGTKKKKDNKKG